MRSVRAVDAAFAALLTVTGLLEVALTDIAEERVLGTAALAVVAASAMLLRSTQPLVCLAITVALVLLAYVPEAPWTLSGALVVGCLLALGGVGRLCRDTVGLPSVLATVSVFVVGAAFAGRPWDVVVALVACGAAWGAGRLLRREVARSEDLRQLAEELVAERGLREAEVVRAERLRMARELHDTVAHAVSVMTLQVGGVRRRLDGQASNEEERDVLLDVEALGREAVAELHRMLGVLRGAEEGGGAHEEALRPQPRLADVELLVARVRAAGVPVELEVEGPVRVLPGGLELTGYRVVQEALTNVLKHSAGSSARVRVAYADGGLEIDVHDDGRGAGGADRPAPEPGGLGLTGLRERVAVYGGLVETQETDSGFRLRAVLPTATAGR